MSVMDFAYELDPAPDAPHAVRTALREDLTGTLASDMVDSVVLVVSELVTNSVIHGPGRPIQVLLSAEQGGTIRGEVRDEGETGAVEICEEIRGDGSGNGLRIVEAISERWGVYEGSTHVWFEVAGNSA
jgi:anti-sigma regulatory factor (Ser/Thr protein kinase)